MAARMRRLRERGMLGYILVLFALTFGLFAACVALGRPVALKVYLYLFGLLPGLVAFGWVERDAGLAPLRSRPDRPWYLLLTVAPFLVHAIAAAIVGLATSATVSLDFEMFSASYIGLNLMLNSLLVLGEEFGWRVYLQDRIVASLGPARGLLALSLIWSLWHLPVDIIGLLQPSAQHGWLILVTRPVDFIGLGYLIGLAYMRTRSVWATCLVHAAHNVSGTMMYTGLFTLTPGQRAGLLVVPSIVYLVVGVAGLRGLGVARTPISLKSP